jgi:ParB family transcriptional regulator, chromosome partitioning protein
LGKNRYVELEIKKAKTNGTGSKVAPQQKPCQKMTEAVVMDGGRRGELVKVCADLSCRVHHPDTPSPEQVAKERAQERKRIEKEKLAITTRHRALAIRVRPRNMFESCWKLWRSSHKEFADFDQASLHARPE